MTEINIDELDKDELANYAKESFGMGLNLRRPIEELREEVRKRDKLKQLKSKIEKTETKPGNNKATHLLNRDTGLWFPYTPLLEAHFTNAVPCDENGKLV